jgi:hypothetical protein
MDTCACCGDTILQKSKKDKHRKGKSINLCDIAVDDHCVKCKRGRQGPRGYSGQDGTQGPTGQNGSTGPTGYQIVTSGPTGPTGINGIDGIDGVTGPTGMAGATGDQGATGFSSVDLQVQSAQDFALDQMTHILKQVIDNKDSGTSLTVYPLGASSTTITQDISLIDDTGKVFTYSVTSGSVTVYKFFSLADAVGFSPSAFDVSFDFDFLSPPIFSNQDSPAKIQTENISILNNYVGQTITVDFFTSVSRTGTLQFITPGVICLVTSGIPYYYNTTMIRQITSPQSAPATLPVISVAKPALITNESRGIFSAYNGANMLFTGINMNQITGATLRISGTDYDCTVTGQSFSSLAITKPTTFPVSANFTMTLHTVSDGDVTLSYPQGYSITNIPFGNISFNSLTKTNTFGPPTIITTPGQSISGIGIYTVSWASGIDFATYMNIAPYTSVYLVDSNSGFRTTAIRSVNPDSRTISFNTNGSYVPGTLYEVVIEGYHVESSPGPRGGTVYTNVYDWDLPTSFFIQM